MKHMGYDGEPSGKAVSRTSESLGALKANRAIYPPLHKQYFRHFLSEKG